MAKKKPATTNSPMPTKSTSSPAAKKSSAAVSATNGAVAGSGEVLGNEQIGLTAGILWSVLSESGASTLSSIKKNIDAPSDLILAAVGWLAREEKLEFTISGKSVTIALK